MRARSSQSRRYATTYCARSKTRFIRRVNQSLPKRSWSGRCPTLYVTELVRRPTTRCSIFNSLWVFWKGYSWGKRGQSSSERWEPRRLNVERRKEDRLRDGSQFWFARDSRREDASPSLRETVLSHSSMGFCLAAVHFVVKPEAMQFPIRRTLSADLLRACRNVAVSPSRLGCRTSAVPSTNRHKHGTTYGQ